MVNEVDRNRIKKIGILSSLLFCLCSCAHIRSDQQPNKVLSLKKVWVKKTQLTPDEGYRKVARMSPLILKDRIVQGNAYDGILAFDRDSGNKIWQIPINGGVEGGVTHVDDYLFFGGNDGFFYSVSINSGEVIWKNAIKAETLAPPLLNNGVVYFLTGNNVLRALDAVDGKEVWIYSRVDSQSLSVRGTATPVVKDGILILGFSDGYLVALNAKTGSLKWEIALNKNKRFRDIDSTAVIDGDLVYVTGYDSHLYCVQLQTGDLVWKAEPGGFGKVLIKENRLYYSTSTGEVLAIDKKNGNTIWRYNLKEGIATSPVLYKNYLAIGESQGSLKLLDLEKGVEVSHLSPGHGIFSPISIDEKADELYFLSNSALLYKVKAQIINNENGSSWIY